MLAKHLLHLTEAANPLKAILLSLLFVLIVPKCNANPIDGLPLYYWQQPNLVNFGDYLSLEIVQRILGEPARVYKSKQGLIEKRLLAVGSILFAAKNDDVIWGSGTNGKRATKNDYSFTKLDVRAVRGPLTRAFLMDNYNIHCPEIYGDPALLMPYLFPEFRRSQDPKYEYIIIPHYAELKLFPKDSDPRIVYPTDHWKEIMSKILDSKFVISSSLHGIIVAEAFGIPARYLRATDKEPLLKYNDYYTATNRPLFNFATTVEAALLMGGEPPAECDLEALYDAFPFEFWPETTFAKPDFSKFTQN